MGSRSSAGVFDGIVVKANGAFHFVTPMESSASGRKLLHCVLPMPIDRLSAITAVHQLADVYGREAACFALLDKPDDAFVAAMLDIVAKTGAFFRSFALVLSCASLRGDCRISKWLTENGLAGRHVLFDLGQVEEFLAAERGREEITDGHGRGI